MAQLSVLVLLVVSILTLIWLCKHIGNPPSISTGPTPNIYQIIPKSSRSTGRRTMNNISFHNSFQPDLLPDFNSRFMDNSSNTLLQNAISNNPAKEVLLNNNQIRHISHQFNHRIKPRSEITNQKNTGRCWIFSFLNMFRYQLIAEYNLPDDFELSQNYLTFYDKLEKAYYFLQLVAMSREEALDSRKIHWLLRNCLSDGGNWNMLVNLIQKYGVVPQHVMPDTYQSGNSHTLNMLLEQNLKRMASTIRNDSQLNVVEYLDQQIYNIYRLLVVFLGKPPTQFMWEYVPTTTSTQDKQLDGDPDSSAIQIPDLNPLLFAERYLKFRSEDWVVVCNFPIQEYPFFQKYNIKYCNNMIDGMPTSMFNLPIEHLRRLVKLNIDAQRPVWVSVDWGKSFSCEYGSLDTELYDLSPFGITNMDKGEEVKYNLATPNHAVLIIGFNQTADGQIDRWLVENSHGDDDCYLGKGHEAKQKGKGYVSMTDQWFRKYVYQVISHIKFLPGDLLAKLQEPAVEIEPWGTIGCELLKVNGDNTSCHISSNIY